MMKRPHSSGGLRLPTKAYKKVDSNGHEDGDFIDHMQKYEEERKKRIRPAGLDKSIDLRRSEKFKSLIEDPWIEDGEPITTPVSNGGHIKILIFGAGFGGILFAVKLIQAGFSVDDLLIVDSAGGFGGTWYWNRYPGLTCEIESYIYLPLLEEMDYMPKRKYASGVEIRHYIEMICTRFDLHKRVMSQSSGTSVEWDEIRKEWVTVISKKPKGRMESLHIIRADFVLFGSCVQNPKVPDVEGMCEYRGYMFHTSRWRYDFTGGTPETRYLNGLRGKNVAVIGTGATAIQVIPEIARHAQQLYVFQRTPASVDRRDNIDTNPDTWEMEVAIGTDWQRQRSLNFIAHTENAQPSPSSDLVDDSWTHFPSWSGAIGTSKKVTMSNVADHISQLHALDFPRQDRIRKRVADAVQDPATVKSLQAWYPGWCKRPCFHDGYLQIFNSPNVQLVDTNGQGVDRINGTGIEHAGQQYDVDLIIWATGIQSPTIGSAAKKNDILVKGRGGIDMEQLNESGNLLTLHGTCSGGFPNMFWASPIQAGATVNHTFHLSSIATHVAYIMSETTFKAEIGTKTIIEPTAEAQERWTARIVEGAPTFAAMEECTPSYINDEGVVDRMTYEQRLKAAKRGVWPNGYASYLAELGEWWNEGTMPGLDVTYISRWK